MPPAKSQFPVEHAHVYIYIYFHMPFMDARLYFLMMCLGYNVMGCDSDAFYDFRQTECNVVEQLYVRLDIRF